MLCFRVLDLTRASLHCLVVCKSGRHIAIADALKQQIFVMQVLSVSGSGSSIDCRYWPIGLIQRLPLRGGP
ncbi:hypothetical protein WJX79_000873 [Trebouxia sp. C0005]